MLLVNDPVKLLEEYVRADFVEITNIIYTGRNKKDVEIRSKDRTIDIKSGDKVIKTKVRDFTVSIQGISPVSLAKEKAELEGKLKVFALNKQHLIHRIKVEIDKPILKIEFTLIDT